MKVCKFGGSSVAGPEQVARVCDIVAADPDRRIVVVSAPGKRHGDDTKVTDLLIATAEAALDGKPTAEQCAAVVARYADIRDGLGLPGEALAQVEALLEQRASADTSHKARFMDALKAAGEDCCARMVAAALQARGVSARYQDPGEAGLLLTDEYGNARLLHQSYDNLGRLADSEEVIVFPGFFGYTEDGHVVTFPRGGSDITGSILAAAVNADVYENFTDVDSVFAVDPRIVADAQPIGELTYSEMRELSYAGFGVFHDEAIIPAIKAGVPICIRNTHRPEAPGTRIVPQRESEHGCVVGISSSPGFCTLFVGRYLMNREIGFGRRLLQIFEEEGLSYEHVPSGIDNMSVIVRESEFTPDAEAQVVARIRDELRVDAVGVERGLALVMIVGEGMRYTVGLAAKATRALADGGVNIEMINQGSSEISIMFGVKAEDRETAVKVLYAAFFESS